MVITDESQFKHLENCVTIEGSLTFMSFTYSNFSCPNLLVIKQGLIIHRVDNLLSIIQLLPNLAYIYGIPVALNITENKDFEKLDFKKLMIYSGGHVVVKGNPRLCLSDFRIWLKIQNIQPPDEFLQV